MVPVPQVIVVILEFQAIPVTVGRQAIVGIVEFLATLATVESQATVVILGFPVIPGIVVPGYQATLATVVLE